MGFFVIQRNTHMKLTSTELYQALGEASYKIATTYYKGPRWVEDKKAIALSLTRSVLHDKLAVISDSTIGMYWIVAEVEPNRFELYTIS